MFLKAIECEFSITVYARKEALLSVSLIHSFVKALYLLISQT